MAYFRTNVLDNQIKALPTIATASGAVANFTTDKAERLVKCVCEVASGSSEINVVACGKNFVPMTVANIKVINTLGTWSGDVYTYNNVVYTLQTDLSGNITGISVNGTANATSQLYVATNFTLQKGSYTINGCPSGGGVETARLQVNASGLLNIDTGSGVNFTLTEVYNSCLCFIRVGSGYNPNGMVFKPMVRLASETDDTFEPYNGTKLNIPFGETLSGNGSFDVLSGILTRSDDTTKHVDGNAITALIGENNIWSDTGDIIDLKFVLSVGKAIS